jgi:prepilin-type N-terminal cleavage/methylation domain-containing protein
MRETLGTGDWDFGEHRRTGLGTGGRARGPRQFASFGTHSVPYADLRPPTSDPRPPISPAPSVPRGITLIEVLIAIFVLAVGLVSVSALLPVAGFQVQRSQIDDRKAQVGPSAAREFRTRAWLRPDYWLYANNKYFVDSTTGILNGWNPGNGAGTGTAITAQQSIPPIAIDPRMIKQFDTSASLFASNGGTIVMPRLTCTSALGAAADQACLSQDDLTFDIAANNPDALPTNGFNSANTKRAFEGRFSWMATLVPVYGDPVAPNPNGTPLNRNSMILSTVVFNQRPTAIAPGTKDSSGANISGERAAQATFTGTAITNPPTAQGIGAGELQMFSGSQNDLAVKSGEWIMLGTIILDPNAPGATPPQQVRPYFRWYRVVSAGPIMSPNSSDPTHGDNRSSGFARDLTISGADWQMALVPPTQTVTQGGSRYPLFWAFIYDGAVAVYERTVHLEGFSMWSN